MTVRMWQATTAAAAVLLALLAVVAIPGSVALTDRTRSGPAWLARCARHRPRGDRILLFRCARVTGRVLLVHPQGTGAARDTHLLVTARLHLFVIKLEGRLHAPPMGSSATFEGGLVRARDGLRELDAWAVAR